LLSHPDDEAADGEATIFNVDLRVNELPGGDEKPTLREVARLGFVPPVQRCLDYGENAPARLVLYFEDVTSQNYNPTTVLTGTAEQILKENGNSRFIQELAGDPRSAGNIRQKGEDEHCEYRSVGNHGRPL